MAYGVDKYKASTYGLPRYELPLYKANDPSGGSAPVYPVTPLAEWPFYDASAVTLNGLDVQTVSDQVASADLTQGTAGKQPLYDLASFNGVNAGKFTRANSDIMLTGPQSVFDSPTNLSFLMVFQVDAFVSNPQYIMELRGGGSGVFIQAFMETSAVIAINIVATTSTVFTIPYTVGDKIAIYVGIDAAGLRTVRYNNTAATLSLGTNPSNSPGLGANVNLGIGARFNDTFHIDSSWAYVSANPSMTVSQIADAFAWTDYNFGVGL